MRGPLMFEIVQENSRKHELRLRDAEKRIAEANSDELRIEYELVQNLAVLADIQIASHPDLGETAIRQLELRADEENSLRRQLAAVEQEIYEFTRQMHVTLAEIHRAEHKEKQYLAADRMYQSVREEHAELLMAHRAMEANHREIDEEVKRKLPQFEQNPVYRHLVSVQFGTDAYQEKGLARRMDNWLAGLCNYHLNRRNEVVLRAMQSEIEGGAQSRKKRLESLKASLEPMLRAATHQVGLPRFRTELERIKSDIEKAKARANSLHERLAEFSEKRDIRYIRTREALTAFLSKQSPEQLLARARRTDTQDDDVVANRVINLQFELKRVQEGYPLLQAERAQAHQEYQKAKALEQRLKDNEFRGDEYEYPAGPDMHSLVHGYMSDRIAVNAIVETLRSHRSLHRGL